MEGLEIKNKLVILLGIFLILVLISGIGSAAEIIVQPGNSIQTVINNASSGDTITLKAGIYTENLNITKGNLTIRSQSGNPDDTIIQAKRSTKDVLIIQAYNVTIRGIEATGSGPSYSGIYLYKCSNCVIENSKVINNGYGIRLTSSSKCKVSKNTVTDNGVYGICFGSSSKNTISGNTAYNSSRGIYLGSSDYNTISGNSVTLNSIVGFYECSLCDHNTVYNNYFNNTNLTIKSGPGNSYNTTKTAGTNIIGGPYIGGNYWGKPDGTGFSDTAVDKDGDGISDSPYTNITNSIHSDYLPLVTPPTPVAPEANFSSNVTEGYAPLSVQFTDLSEYAVSLYWDFGDGAKSIEKNPIHTYSTAGIYTVNLTVSNAYGTDSKLATISVLAHSALTAFPGYTNPPSDLNQDGLYEDINGNGMLDFDDVVAYYDNMEWIEENVPVDFFDYNKNGLIDFDDVVKLYDML